MKKVIVLAVLLVFIIGFGCVSQNSGSKNISPTNPNSSLSNLNSSPNPSAVGVVPISQFGPNINVSELIRGDMRMGNASAPVVLVEFSDYQCPFCRRFTTLVLPNLTADYVNKGKLELVYRNFPYTNIHPGAMGAAQAVECAKLQGKQWQMHNIIYDKQAQLGLSTYPITVNDFKVWASEIGLNRSVFDICINSEDGISKIQSDINYGKSIGVDGTPYFFIARRDGRDVVPIIGAQPIGTMRATIDQLLER
ncbi:thioredoxin domain-containing protein [Candidatus Micrarchaeota archaeon]|nr:thioredoxin domain-containing protein [Candidatus Micrarchaeota archaeon]